MIPRLLFVLFGLFLSLVAAVDLKLQIDTNLKPKEEDKNGKLKTNKGWILFSSYVDVNETPTHGQLAKMAKDAGDSIKSLPDAKKVHNNMLPPVVTAFAVDKQVFLSSSLSGDKYVYKSKNPVTFSDNVKEVEEAGQLQKALENCMTEAAAGEHQEQPHRAKANCGEIMVSYEWLMAHGGKQLKGKSPKPLIVAYNRNMRKIVPPCSEKKNEGDHGCIDFVGVKGLDFETVDKSTKFEDYDCIIEGEPKHLNLPVKVPNRGANAEESAQHEGGNQDGHQGGNQGGHQQGGHQQGGHQQGGHQQGGHQQGGHQQGGHQQGGHQQGGNQQGGNQGGRGGNQQGGGRGRGQQRGGGRGRGNSNSRGRGNSSNRGNGQGRGGHPKREVQFAA